MRLRTTRPPVTRLSRKVLLGLGTIAAVGIGGALFVALQPNRETTGGSELYNTNNRTTPSGLATLPRDYSGLPRVAPQLGPPLPGDLGRPILNAGAPPPGMPTPAAPPDPEKQRLIQEREAARTSHLFAITNTQQAQSTASAPPPSSSAPANAGVAEPATVDHKLAFLNRNVDRRTVSPDRVDAPASPYVLQAGAVIPAALLTGLPPMYIGYSISS
jgi:type IV secretion system protein VirB10